MTVIEQEPSVVDNDTEGWKPIAHLPKNPLEERPRVAMCGAPMLGIKATGDFEMCPKCEELLKWLRQR